MTFSIAQGGRRILAAWVDACARMALEVVLLVAVAVGGALYYTAGHLGIYTDTDRMLSEKLPFRRAYEQYKRDFPQFVDTLVVVVDGATPDLAMDASKKLAARLAQETELFKTLYTPGGGEFFERRGLLFLDIEELQALADNLTQMQPFLGKLTQDMSLAGLFAMLDAALAAVTEGEALDLAPLFERIDESLAAVLEERWHQLSWQELILGRPSTTGERRRLIIAQPHLDYAEFQPAEAAINTVRRLAEGLDLAPENGVQVRLTGSVALAYEELQTVRRGAEIAGLLALVMVGTVLVIGLRSWQLVLGTLLALIAGLILTAGFAAAAVGQLNLISIAFAVLYIGLGVDYAIHFCLRYQELHRRRESRQAALRGAAALVGGSLALCALTTALGFYAFVPTAFSGVSELGLIAGTGMFIGFLVTMTLLPALLALLPSIRPALSEEPKRAPVILRFLPPPRIVLRGALALGVAALLLLPLVRFDFNPIHLRNPETESIATFNDLTAESDTSPWTIIALAENAGEARLLASRFEQLETVAGAVMLEDFVPKNQVEKLAVLEDLALIMGPQFGLALEAETDEDDARRIGRMQNFLKTLAAFVETQGDKAQAAEDLRLSLQRFLELLPTLSSKERRDMLARLEYSLLGSLPGRLTGLQIALTAAPVTVDNLPQALKERWVSADGRYRVQVFPESKLENNAELRRFVREAQSVAPAATGEAILNLEAGNAVVRAFFQAFSYALAAVVALLLVLLKPKRDVLLVLAPLLLASVLTGAATVVLGLPFNFANVIALPLLLGIGVDSGIHMVHRFRNAPPADGNLLGTSTARAVPFSALTTIVSFGNLAFSPHPGTAGMGLLLTLGIGFTLLSTLIVLPALLWRWGTGAGSGKMLQ